MHEYLPGDALVVPIGYSGTWELQGNYRELVVINEERKVSSRCRQETILATIARAAFDGRSGGAP